MHPLNKYFDKVFIITIGRNSHRLDTFLKKNPFLKIEIFQGIDGKELYPKIEYVYNFPKEFFIENQLDYDRCKTLNKGQLGCAMSNRNVQIEIVKLKIPKALILEDDALYLEKNLSVFCKALQEIPLNWDLFYLGYNPISKWSEVMILRIIARIKYLIFPVVVEGHRSSTLKKRFFSKRYSANLNIPGIYTGTHAYALSYEGACKTTALDTPLKHGFDTLLMYANYNNLLKAFSLKKPLFLPNSNFETTLIN